MATDTSERTGTTFGDDDLGRVRTILFGDLARETSERIDTLEQALLGAIADLRTEVLGRLDAEAETRTTAVSNLGDRLDAETKARTKAEKATRSEIDSVVERLTGNLDSASSSVEALIEQTRSELAAQIETAEQQLRDSKVDRSALAGLLSATVDQLQSP